MESISNEPRPHPPLGKPGSLGQMIRRNMVAMMVPVAVDDDCDCFGTADKLYRDLSSFCHDKNT